jgi:hypothetical protein
MRSLLYEELFKKKIDLLNGLIKRHQDKVDRLLSRMKYDMDDAYAKGRLTKVHFDLLIKKFSDYES